MMKMKKFIACILALTLFGAVQVSAEDDIAPRKTFFDVKGTVVEKDDRGYWVIEDAEGMPHVFIITDDTHFISGSKDEIKAGDRVAGYVNSNKPMLMIYPPQYNVDAIAVNYDEVKSIKVDRFDENALSWDKELKLNLSENTEIIYQDGTPFDGALSDLADRMLIVEYTITTRSIPPQTPPEKVTVLFETAIPPIIQLPEDWDLPESTEEVTDEILILPNPEITEIVVEGNIITARTPYYNADGVLMVPVRAIAEALGYDVEWEDATETAFFDGGRLSLTVGKNIYVIGRMAPIELSAVPENINDSVFVPLEFFRVIAGVNNAYVLEGQVVVDNFELLD